MSICQSLHNGEFPHLNQTKKASKSLNTMGNLTNTMGKIANTLGKHDQHGKHPQTLNEILIMMLKAFALQMKTKQNKHSKLTHIQRLDNAPKTNTSPREKYTPSPKKLQQESNLKQFRKKLRGKD
jgi:hypothetical protein